MCAIFLWSASATRVVSSLLQLWNNSNIIVVFVESLRNSNGFFGLPLWRNYFALRLFFSSASTIDNV